MVIGEPHVADTWFPVNDHPSDKAAYTFRIAVPAGLEAVANGVLKGKRTRTRLDHLDLGRQGADGVLPGHRDDRAVRAARLSAAGRRATGTRSIPTSSTRPYRGPDSSSPCPTGKQTAVVQAAGPDDQRAGRGRGPVVLDHSGH